MENITTLVIGDPHFKYGAELDVQQYITKVVSIAQKYNPTFIVILGDVLDTHETVKVQPHKLVESFFESLSQISPTYVLMGNHDLINASQFLTTNHIYGPFKKWESLYIVDKPVCINISEKQFVFVPYVPPGRFIEALDTLVKDGYTWDLADCIFAHQEMRGCKMNGGKMSEDGDEWSEDYPLIISGHMHSEQKLGDNIMYPGNSIQHAFDESSDKKVWLVTWVEDYPKIQKIKIGLRPKTELNMSVDELLKKENDTRFLKRMDEQIVKINLKGESADIKNFRRHKFYDTLVSKGVVIIFGLTQIVQEKEILKNEWDCSKKDDTSYESILEKMIADKNSEHIRREYEAIFKKGEKV